MTRCQRTQHNATVILFGSARKRHLCEVPLPCKWKRAEGDGGAREQKTSHPQAPDGGGAARGIQTCGYRRVIDGFGGQNKHRVRVGDNPDLTSILFQDNVHKRVRADVKRPLNLSDGFVAQTGLKKGFPVVELLILRQIKLVGRPKS